MSAHELIIVGAGIVGAACADVASAEGFKVTVVEPGPIGGGVTAAGMGHLVSMDAAPWELALTHYSLGLWESLHDLPGSEYSRCGTLWVARSDAEGAHIADKQARLAGAGIRAEVVDGAQLRQLEPELISGLAGGLLVPDEGVVYPPAVARAMIARACHRGATLERARVTAVGDHEVTLDSGQHLRGTVVVAAGCALPTLLPELPLRLRKGHLVITQRYPGTVRHQLVHLGYADSVHGNEASVAFNVQPRPTGQLLIGSSREYGRTDTEVSMPMVRRMLRHTFEFLPGVRRLNALRIWTGLRPASTDGRPYIGPVGARPGVWVAAGHEGLGVSTAPGTARLLVDQLLGHQPAIDMQPFDPMRMAA